jgi:nucleotide-binding universal stress UspA family protein
MYTRILLPLDGSKTAEKVLPYGRFLASTLKLPVELLTAIDIAEIAKRISAEKARYLNTLIENNIRTSEQYLSGIARKFEDGSVKCTVEKGAAEDVIIEKAAADKGTLISMATHGRSGINRWLLGSVAEKVLRSTTNPLLLIRATEEAKTEGEATLKSAIVPLDGSELAECVLPTVAELAKPLQLEVILFRAYTIPYSALAADAEGFYLVPDEELIAAMRDEAVAYLEKKAQTIKKLGVERVSTIAEYGFAPDEIIALARKTPDNLIAMCSHGRSGVKRWVLGSVTETVVRHSGDPVLMTRPT